MKDIQAILAETHHRPFPMPTRPWFSYQRWRNVLMLHWPCPANLLEPVLPNGLKPEEHGGECFVSVVAFTVEGFSLKQLPPFPYISNFHELNLRTYVSYQGKPGIYFLSIQASKWLSAMLSKMVTGLPYVHSDMSRSWNQFTSKNQKQNFELAAVYRKGEEITVKNDLDWWLTERYCLFQAIKGKLYEFEIHHREWPLKKIILDDIKIKYHVSGVQITGHTPSLAHFSSLQEAILWQGQPAK